MLYFVFLIAALLLTGILIWMKDSKNIYTFLGIAFIVGISIFSIFFLQSKKAESSLRVVGYSSKQFESDLVKWNLSLQKSVGNGELSSGYRTMNADVKAFRAYLVEQGFAEDEISVQPVSSFPRYDNYGAMTGYNINQEISCFPTNWTRWKSSP